MNRVSVALFCAWFFSAAQSPPWLQTEALRPVTMGLSDQSQVTGDGGVLFWTKSDNQALTVLWQKTSTALVGSSTTTASPFAEPEALFEPQHDTSSPDWDPGSQRLVFLSHHKSARGQICLWSLAKGRPWTTSPAAVDPEGCFDHPGKVSQPTWGPQGRIYFLSHALPWEQGTEDALWVLDPRTRVSRRVASYPRLGSFTVHPESGDVVAVGWHPMLELEPVVGSGLPAPLTLADWSRPRMLLLRNPGARALQDIPSAPPTWMPFMPGFPGFPASPRFDAGSDRLLWGQFVDDSNQDDRVDGDDGSVILALPWSKVRRQIVTQAAAHNETKTTAVPKIVVSEFPSQLTAGRDNCLFPRVIGGTLFVTCAPQTNGGGEGMKRRLNVYVIPRSGVVPSTWDASTLLRARAEARDPSMQALLTNVWLSRHHTSGQRFAVRRESLQLVAIHLEAGDVHAAREAFELWTQESQTGDGFSGTEDSQVLEDLLVLVLEAVQLRFSKQSFTDAAGYGQSMDVLGARLLRIQEAYLSQGRRGGNVEQDLDLVFLLARHVARQSIDPSLTSSLVKLFHGNRGDSKKSPDPKPTLRSDLLSVFFVAMARSVKLDVDQGAMDTTRGADTLALLARAALRCNLRLALSLATDALAMSRHQKIGGTHSKEKPTATGLPKLLGQDQGSFGEPTLDALQQTQSEVLALVGQAKGDGADVDEQSKSAYRKLYGRVEALLKPDNDRQRLVYRAHTSLVGDVLSRSNQTLLFGFHAANWLARTPLRTHEYMMVLDFYRSVTLSRAYAAWSAGRMRAAADLFYGASRLTQDEESHLGFVLTARASGLSAQEMATRYEGHREVLGELSSGEPLLGAVLALLDYEAEVAKAPRAQRLRAGDPNKLAQALKALAVPQMTSPVVRDWIDGYVAHERYRRSLDPDLEPWWSLRPHHPGGDAVALQRASRSYLLALERVPHRPQLRAALASALGQLHFLSGSFASAAGYFEMALADLSDDAPQRLAWTLNWARSLGRSGRPEAAYRVLESFETRQGIPKSSWWHGRLAFFAAEAGMYDEACSRYGLSHKSTKEQRAQRNEDPRALAWRQGWLEHEGWACLNADGETIPQEQEDWHTDRLLPREQGRMVLSRLFQELRSSGLQTGQDKSVSDVFKNRGVRSDVLDDVPSWRLARVAGLLAQSTRDPQERMRYFGERVRALSLYVNTESRTALPHRLARLYLAKASSERALVALTVNDQNTLREGMDTALGALSHLAGSAGARKSSGGLLPAYDDIEVLRFLGLLWLAGNDMSAPHRSRWAKDLQTYFEVSFGYLAKANSTKALTSSWSDDLVLHYLQLGTIMRLIKQKELGTQQGSDGFCQQAVSAEGLSALLPKNELPVFARTEVLASLESWCQGLFNFSLWRADL